MHGDHGAAGAAGGGGGDAGVGVIRFARTLRKKSAAALKGPWGRGPHTPGR